MPPRASLAVLCDSTAFWCGLITHSIFASGTSNYSHPDSVVADNGHVFIGYQNLSGKTGGGTSTIVEYTMDGKVVKTFSVPGHSDGMRADPSTHLIWTTSNEDGNPSMATIDPKSGIVTPYTFAKTPHGGGYDDLYFLLVSCFLVCSCLLSYHVIRIGT